MSILRSYTDGARNGSLALQSANNIGGGSALPNPVGVTSPQDNKQLSSWLFFNWNPGADAYTDSALWKEFISGPAWSAQFGKPLTRANYRQAAKEESQRLFNLGFVQVHEPEKARLIYESYARAASEEFSYLPITEESAELKANALESYNWSYITANILDDLGDGVGKVVRKTGNVANDLGETISNPFTLPAIAVIGVVGLVLFSKL